MRYRSSEPLSPSDEPSLAILTLHCVHNLAGSIGHLVHNNISDEDWNALVEGLVLKRYHLLLGAGASRDVQDRNGITLPGGDEMATEMASTFQITVNDRERTDLPRIFRAAERHKTTTGQSRSEWIAARFSRTQPPAWYEMIHSVSWKTMWTLNIDDALEESIEGNCRSVHFTDQVEEVNYGTPSIVHLHGSARTPSKGVVFTIDEYNEYILRPRSWPIRFQEVLSDNPFVILGAALHHEVDLISSLRTRSAGRSRIEPTIAVMPNPSAMDIEDFAQWNIKIFDGTAEQFLVRMRDSLVEARVRLVPTGPNRAPSPTLVSFLERWRPIARTPRSPWHDYLGGEEPQYADAASDSIVERSMQAAIIRAVEQGEPVLIYGPPFSGKSSVALSSLRQLENQDWRVFSFDGDSEFDHLAVIAKLRENPESILYIDFASEFTSSIQRLLQHAETVGIPVRLVAVARSGPIEQLRATRRFTEFEIPETLTEKELILLWTKLKQSNRLVRPWSAMKGMPTFNELKNAGVTSMSRAISVLVLGEAFESRVQRDYRSIADPSVRSVAILAALGSRVSGGITLGVVAVALGISARLIEDKLATDNMGASIVRLDNGRLRLRHRFFSEYLTDSVVLQKEMKDVVTGLCFALAPQLSLDAIKHRTWAHRMSRHVLDHDQLSNLIGRSELDNFYTTIEGAFSWNARFWEQRALAADKDHASVIARQYANRALETYRDSYTLNTVATILLRQIKYRDNLSPADQGRVHEGFWDAVVYLREARNTAKATSEHPFVNFFTNVIRYGRWQIRTSGELSFAVRKEWNEWYRLAQESSAYVTPERLAGLQQYQHEWLLLVTN